MNRLLCTCLLTFSALLTSCAPHRLAPATDARAELLKATEESERLLREMEQRDREHERVKAVVVRFKTKEGTDAEMTGPEFMAMHQEIADELHAGTVRDAEQAFQYRGMLEDCNTLARQHGLPQIPLY